jgi:hypothetical protein
MHPHSTNDYDPDWEWGPPQQRSQPGAQQLTLLLTRRMAAQLHAVAHDLELSLDEAALLLLRDTLWRHYHMMQHL